MSLLAKFAPESAENGFLEGPDSKFPRTTIATPPAFGIGHGENMSGESASKTYAKSLVYFKRNSIKLSPRILAVKMQEMAFQRVKISIFSGGACPRTPLGSSRLRRESRACGARWSNKH